MEEFNPPQEPTYPTTLENQVEFNFANCCTPTLQMGEITKYSQYINMRIKLSIQTRCPPTPTVARVYEKRDKALHAIAYAGKLAEEELFAKAAAKKAKLQRKAGNRHIQRYCTIIVSNGRLRVAAQNEQEDAAKLAIQGRESQREVVRVQKVRTQELDLQLRGFLKTYHPPHTYSYVTAPTRKLIVQLLLQLQDKVKLKATVTTVYTNIQVV
jgi:hypothetical protein